MKIKDLEFNIKRLRLEPDDIVIITFNEDDITPSLEHLEDLRLRFEEVVPNRCIVLSHGGRIYTLKDADFDEMQERWNKLSRNNDK